MRKEVIIRKKALIINSSLLEVIKGKDMLTENPNVY